DQQFPMIVRDGAGGAIVTWQDSRGGGASIYAQHVLSTGAVDGAWPSGGRVPATVGGQLELKPSSTTERAGGALGARKDGDDYAQHVLSSGALDGAWPSGGLALCSAAGQQDYPTIATDGVGGAIVAWADGRNGNDDIYAAKTCPTVMYRDLD